MRFFAQLMDHDRQQNAIDYLKRVANQQCGSAEASARYNLALLLEDQENWAESLSQIDLALKLNEDARYHQLRLRALFKLNRFPEAISAAQHALKLRPDDIDSRQLLATLLLSSKQYAAAKDQLNELMQLRPGDLGSRFYLATAYLAQQKTVQAIAEYRTLLNQNPNFHPAANNLAWLYATHADAKLRNGPEALRLATQICANTPSPNYLDTLAMAQAEVGDFTAALVTARRALAMFEEQGNSPKAASLKKRIPLLESGRAYRDSP